MERYITYRLKKDLKKKPILLSGPRQCGKTFLGKSLAVHFEYINFDVAADRKKLIKLDWFRNKDLVIFDELHKMKKWKNFLKGVFDANKEKQKFLVTGSAKMDTYKKVGDSLAGRYFSYRLFPFDLKELLENFKTLNLRLPKMTLQNAPQKLIDRLLEVSGFPEPFLTKEKGFYQKWQQTHMDVILRQDILETESVKNIKQIETLAYLLTERVGSPLSYSSLREDLSTDDKSVKRWVDILENSYVLFRIYPFTTSSLVRGLKKAPKIYFFDYVRVENMSARLENMVALAIQKEVCFRRDALGEVFDLFYVRNKDQKEIDFLITKNKKPHLLIEVKESDTSPSKSFFAYENIFKGVKKIQLVKNLHAEHLTKHGVRVVPMHHWLAKMNF